jgi:hypothetical protein
MRAKLFKEILNEEEFTWFKGPSKEKILKAVEGKTLKEKFKLAVRNNIKWLAKECVEQGVLEDEYLTNKFIASLEYDIPKLTKFCLSEGIDPNMKFWFGYPLDIACKHGSINVVKVLLDDPATIISDWSIARAAEHGHIDVIKLILNNNRKIKISTMLRAAVKFAKDNHHSDIVEYLLQDRRISSLFSYHEKLVYKDYIKSSDN